MNEKKDDNVRGLINAGAELAGGATAGGLGVLVGGAVAGPPGAIAGGAIGTAAALALRRAGEEISERLLGPREKVRAGAVLAIAASEIKRRTEAGEKLRTDDFFDAGSRGRSQAEEVAESVLLKAQREPEEKKVRFMAYLLSNIAFDTSVSAELAHQLTKVAEQLTYRQLCLLRLAALKEKYQLRATDYRGEVSFAMDVLQVLYECFDLYQRGLVNFGGVVAFGPSDVNPAAMIVQGIGASLHNLMRLSAIPEEEIGSISARLA